MVQMCENYQIRRADSVEKNSQSFEEAKPLTGILALVWLLHECKLQSTVKKILKKFQEM